MPRKGLWRGPDFLKLWTGQAVSQFGSRITRSGLPLTAVMILGASPLQMGLLDGAGGAAVLLFGLFAGVWADRLRRRPILIAADLGRFAVLATIPIAAALHRLAIGQLYLVAATTGILTVLFDVSYQAYLPSLVNRENILEGNSKMTLTESIAEIAGPGATGILVQVMTAPIAILIDAISFLVSAVSLMLIRKREPRPDPGPDPHIGREIAEGLRACWTHPVLRAIAGRTATAAFFLGFISSLYVLFTIRVLGLSPAVFGFIIAIGGVSALVGNLVAERLMKHFGFGRTLIASAIVAGIASFGIPLAHGSAGTGAAFLIATQVGDVSWPVYTIAETSLRQTVTPDRLLGRVNSAMHILFRGIVPVGAVVGGAAAQFVGVRTALFAGAAGFLLSTLWLVFSPVRHLQTLGDQQPAHLPEILNHH
jgi:predicted MFS family arabinose efflux permease